MIHFERFQKLFELNLYKSQLHVGRMFRTPTNPKLQRLIRSENHGEGQ